MRIKKRRKNRKKNKAIMQQRFGKAYNPITEEQREELLALFLNPSETIPTCTFNARSARFQSELLKKIKNEEEHDAAISRLRQLMDLESLDEQEENELYLLALVIKDYESEHYPLSKESALEYALKAYLEKVFPNSPEKVKFLTQEHMEKLT